jgi:ATP-binding cassette, subfamily B, bacterial MsbA
MPYAVTTWSRLAGFVRPYWRPLAGSLVFGLIVAALWSVELLLTFPVVKVFLQEQSLPDYVRQEVAKAEGEVSLLKQKLSPLDERLLELPEDGTEGRFEERERTLNDQAREQRRLNSASYRLWTLSWVEAEVVPRLPSDQFVLLVWLFGLLLVITAVKGACSVAQDVLVASVSERTVIDLREALFRQTLKLDPQSVAAQGVPQLISSMTYDLQSVAGGLSEVGGKIVREPLKAVSCLGAAFFLNWQLTLLSLVFLPIAGLMYRRLGRSLRQAAQRTLTSMGQIYKSLEETFTNIKVVIAFDAAGGLRRRFHRQNREFYRQALRIVRIDAVCNPSTEMLGQTAVCLVLLPCAYLVLNQATSIWGVRLSGRELDFSDLSVMYALMAGMLDSVRKFSKFYTTIKQTGTAAEVVFERMDRESLVRPAAEPVWLGPLSANIELEGVHFSYHRESDGTPRHRALDGVDLRISAGETIAIVGPNGCGKSTLVNLLTRFADPDEGVVRFDGIDLREVRVRDVRSQMAVVTQDAVLFDGTLLENIRYGRPEASDIEVREAALRAHVLEFADLLPAGLQTVLGKDGRNLSGGQRQRISLARTLLRDPHLLILDEPTSAVDAQSELLIQQTLREFSRGRTVILITHSLNQTLLEFIDRIVVMDRGRVIASGCHVDLASTCPHYARLFVAPQRDAA